MSVIVAINQNEMQVMLEDERVLPITGLYSRVRHGGLDPEDKVDDWSRANHFSVGFPDQPNVHLIVDVAAMTVARRAN